MPFPSTVVAGAALQRAVRAVRVQRRRLGVARVVDRRTDRVEAVDRLVAALTADVLMPRV